MLPSSRTGDSNNSAFERLDGDKLPSASSIILNVPASRSGSLPCATASSLEEELSVVFILSISATSLSVR